MRGTNRSPRPARQPPKPHPHPSGDVRPGSSKYGGTQTRHVPMVSGSSTGSGRPMSATHMRPLSASQMSSPGRPLTAKSTRSHAQMNTTQNAPQGPPSEEYVSNLQQQIYWLELEMRLLREREKTGHPMMVLGNDVQAEPVDRQLAGLRARYLELEKKHESDKKDLAKAVDQHECEVLQRDAQIAEFKTILREKDSVIEDLNAIQREERGQWHEESVALNQKIESLQQELADNIPIHEQFKQRLEDQVAQIHQQNETYRELAAEVDSCKQATIAANQRVRQQEEEKKALQLRLTQMEEESAMMMENPTIYRDEISKLQEQKWAAETEARRLAAEMERAIKRREKAEEDYKNIFDANVALQKRLDKTQGDLTLEERRNMERSRVVDTAARERSDLKAEVQTLRDEINQQIATISQQQERLRSSEGQGRALAREKERIDLENLELREKLRLDRGHIDEMTENEARLREENLNLGSNLTHATQKANISETDRETGLAELVKLRGENKQLKKKLEISATLSDIKAQDFTTMAENSMALAGHLKTLMSQIDTE
eukprot:TRINITY_DN6295_c0_g1_i1.p1 TRINITY_DN6295_c0_g1~~TRINITY_DN6295_c0_g1_i1.p1  ORF type:complete len:548 (+),score=116.42 TRINITY_DN6295_c0_g1_i1:105-1748(+)